MCFLQAGDPYTQVVFNVGLTVYNCISMGRPYLFTYTACVQGTGTHYFPSVQDLTCVVCTVPEPG